MDKRCVALLLLLLYQAQDSTNMVLEHSKVLTYVCILIVDSAVLLKEA